jgi:hypothetical protein
VVAAGGRSELAGRDDGHAGAEPKLDPPERVAQPLLAPAGERAHVGAREDGVGAEVAREPRGLGDRVAAVDDEPAAALAQARVEVAERLVEEAGAHLAAAGEPLLAHEQRHDLVGLARRSGERRLVVDAEVAREEGDRHPHAASLVLAGGRKRGG